MHLTRLRAEHARAVLAFERENRAYFARSIPDRGDDYFAHFDSRHAALLAEQETGACHFHLLLDDHGDVLGRVNLVDVNLVDDTDSTADLGYRVAERAAGRGLAGAAVREIRARAATDYGLTALTAATTLDNPASRAVLTRNGFVPVGDIDLGGRPGTRYQLRLGQWIG
ncbi:GNAT family N-acetyltransferase [Streptomyces agglomeratus]|uniref:GNAT family N-acetyltransferase n=1 Tax=Streptomyces agglomeratus TaxID=285458 RepID=A0A1E5PJE6_9ACTN|nr:GNAT family N-acetyltransferase [Streptomyces agglomeratus]OEJ42328.1 GNAT family N-acetyltransferase [Streptomyces agglomeratus]OEJ49164.1 GNAT family N-acetyltransferase [Streptomyces agglomeratus]OEJ55641.1 GNAT family N-acetyltransferase [Streptomyces agglomeratus]OEJ63026.1 GNAT family N-acetyltransferase [Streptomyces agglomeratus]